MSSGYFNNLSSKNLAFKAITNGTTMSYTASALVIFPAVSYDRTNAYNTSTGKWTIPVTAVYDVSISWFLTTPSTFQLSVYRNGADAGRLLQTGNDPTRVNFVGTNKFLFNQGDIISLVVASGSASLYVGDIPTCQLTCTILS